MKSLKRQIFGLLIVLSGVIPLSGMNLSQLGQKARLWGINNRIQKKDLSSATVQVPQLQRINVKPTKRSFSRSVAVEASAQKKGSSDWWNWLFPPKEMTTQEYSMHIDTLLNGHVDPAWRAPNRRIIYDKKVFNENDLKKVKEEIDLNREYIMDYSTGGWRFGWSFYWVLDESQKKMSGTILDKVLCMIFNGDQYGMNDFAVSDSTLNYIKLAQDLRNKGVTINPDNEEKYVKIYCDFLMPRYRELYEPNPGTRYGVEYELEKIKKTFEGLDALLEQLISNQDLKKQLTDAQKERANIEKDESKFREKQEDEENRDEYLRAKAKYEKIQKWHMTKNPDDLEFGFSPIYDQLKKQRFNETEYQAWLKSGKNAGFFHGYHWEGFKFNFGGGSGQKLNNSDLKIYSLLSIPESSTNAAVRLEYREFMKKNHPDYAQNESDKKERTNKVADVNDAYDVYNEFQKRINSNKE